MDSFRTRNHAQQPKAVDGFFTRPQAARKSSGHTNLRQTASGNSTLAGRSVQDFKRTDGFHSAPRRTAASFTSTATQSIAQQFDAPVAPHSKIGRRGRAKAHAPISRLRKITRWTMRGTAIMLVILLAVGGLLFGKGYLKLKKVFNGTSTAAALEANVDPSQLKGEGDGRVNILMLGIGGADHDGSDLTDTMMVASVDPVNNQAVLFSIPRDLWVKMPNNYIANYQKINAAYESGKYKYLGQDDSSNANQKAIQAGFQAVDGTVENVLGVPIHYNLLVNFQAFRQAVDTVGGVTINAPEQLYDPTMAWENGWNPVLAKAGINNFDGKHALNYVRSRETTSDFARAQRQRAVMVALKEKVMNLGTLTNPLKLSSLLNAFGDNVKSDISLNDMTRMASIMKKIPNDQIQSVGLTDGQNSFITTGTLNGLSIVQPKAGLEDYSQIQAFVRSKLKDGYIAKEAAKVTVLNGTVTPGLAGEKADELKTYGYNIGTVDNAPTTDYDKTMIVDMSGGAKKYTLSYLKNRYHVDTISKTLPTGVVQNGADIVIILGQDATVTSSN